MGVDTSGKINQLPIYVGVVKMKKTVKIGIVGIDRSGSKADFPIVIVAAYSEKVGNFEKAIAEVKKKTRIEREELKGKEFKPSVHKNVIEIIRSNGISFFAYLVDRDVYSHLRNVYWRKKWEQRLEAVLWYKACSLLIKRTGKMPAEVFYEKTYTSDPVFDKVFKGLLKEKLGMEDVGVGSKYAPYIMIADWIANFFHKNSEIRLAYKNFFVKCEQRCIEDTLWDVLKGRINAGSRLVGGTAAGPRNDQTIYRMQQDVFKGFGDIDGSIQKL